MMNSKRTPQTPQTPHFPKEEARSQRRGRLRPALFEQNDAAWSCASIALYGEHSAPVDAEDEPVRKGGVFGGVRCGVLAEPHTRHVIGRSVRPLFIFSHDEFKKNPTNPTNPTLLQRRSSFSRTTPTPTAALRTKRRGSVLRVDCTQWRAHCSRRR